MYLQYVSYNHSDLVLSFGKSERTMRKTQVASKREISSLGDNELNVELWVKRNTICT